MAEFVRHSPCEDCGSSDARAIYSDGSEHCFSCKGYTRATGETVEIESTRKPKNFVSGSYEDIPQRKLKEKTCAFYGYQIGETDAGPCHVANYRDPKTREVVAQKLRWKAKKFAMTGDGKGAPLFGQHLWGGGGKSVVITEGEIDCLSIAQAFECKWPVVSLSNGASAAEKSIKGAYEWLDTFEKIVLCFDEDDPGREAVEAVCPLLPPGKAYVMRLPRKDANEVLINDGPALLTKAYWGATAWRPDGIRTVSELRQAVLEPPEVPTVPYPYSGLNEKLGGLRRGELLTLTSGSGLGKSTLGREFIYDLAVTHGQTVGIMALEESNARTIEGLMSIYLSKNLMVDRDQVPKETLSDAFSFIAGKGFYLWDHFGSNQVDQVLTKMRYMVKVLGCQWLYLDHLSILLSGLETQDERKLIDKTMTELRSLVQETGCGMILISHLKRPEGNKGHEDGAEVHLGQLRGSHAIAQLSDAVIGLQKDGGDPTGDTIEPVVLKNRWSGNRGSCGLLMYDRGTGRLSESGF